ncbi:MAG: hypothetical protein ACE5HL_10120 [Terriglobia bacterium]
MTKKSFVIALVILVGLSLAVFTIVQAQESEPGPTAQKAPQCPCMKGKMKGGMMGGMQHGKMGPMRHRMMGREGGMMGLCPLRVPGTKVDVKALDNGVTISVTAEDAKVVRRIQRMAEIMRLMRELHSEQ